MPPFPSNPYPSSSRRSKATFINRIIPSIRRQPFLLFGLPFTLTIVTAAYGLSYLTQTRYEYNATKVSALSKEEELGMKRDRRKIDLREEYFKLGGGTRSGAGPTAGQSEEGDAWENWEPKRVPRPEGTEEWGVGGGSTGSYVESASNMRDYKGKRRATGPIAAEGPEEGTPLPGGNRVIITEKGERLVIGPDGKPCRSCSSRLAFADAMRGSGGGGSAGKMAGGVGFGAAAASTSSAASSDRSISQVKGCPPDVEELGRSTWDFLHSVAATYPDKPTETQRSALLSLLTSLPVLYPCGHCADALSEDYARRAVERPAAGTQGKPLENMTLQEATESKRSAARFMCSIHNEVNVRLGKPVWNCDDLGRLKRRWEDGGERCF